MDRYRDVYIYIYTHVRKMQNHVKTTIENEMKTGFIKRVGGDKGPIYNSHVVGS